MEQTIAIVGSQEYPDLVAVRAYVRRLPAGTVVVSGGAPGVDRTAADEAKRCGLRVIIIPADWNRHGKKAGMIRNAAIVRRAESVVAFWDGKSPGTANTIRRAKGAGKPVTVNPHIEQQMVLPGME